MFVGVSGLERSYAGNSLVLHHLAPPLLQEKFSTKSRVLSTIAVMLVHACSRKSQSVFFISENQSTHTESSFNQ